MTDRIYYVNGTFVPAAKASLSLHDLAIVRGYGVFDLLRTYRRVPFRLREHVNRFKTSCEGIGIEIGKTGDEIEALVLETHNRNDLENAYIRLLGTGGYSSDCYAPEGTPSLCIMVEPVGEKDASLYNRGGKTITVRGIRERPRIKTLNYLTAITALRDAKREDIVEAIFRTEADHLTEGTRANFFLFKGETLVTPADEILLGITRDVILALAQDPFAVETRPLLYRELIEADEAFLTSTTKDVLPIVQVDDIVIGNGTPGHRTRQLMSLFDDVTRTNTCSS